MERTEQPKSQFLTHKEVASMLRVSLRHYHRCVRPYLPAVYIGARALTDVRDLHAFIESRKVRP